MKKKEPLSPKEENFCRFFVASREPRASAARAGYSVHPERTAMRLLADPEIKRRIAKLENERDAKLAEVTEGYRRLAFGSVADAVKLILSDELPDGSEIELHGIIRTLQSVVDSILVTYTPKVGGLTLETCLV